MIRRYLHSILVEKTVRLKAEDTSSNHPKVKEQKTSARASDRKRGPISITSERDRAEGSSLYLSLSFVYQYNMYMTGLAPCRRSMCLVLMPAS